MKKVIVVMLSLLLVMTLSSCAKEEQAVPLENPDISLYQVFYEADEYSLLVKKNITQEYYVMYALIIGPKDDTCHIGAYHEVNFIVLYQGSYYSVREADKLGIYDCDELEQIGFLGVMNNHFMFVHNLTDEPDDNRMYAISRYTDEIENKPMTIDFKNGALYYFEDANVYNQYHIISSYGFPYSLEYALRTGLITIDELLSLNIPELQSVDNQFTMDDKEYYYTYMSDDFNIYWWHCVDTCVTTTDEVSFTQGDTQYGIYSSSEKSKYYFQQGDTTMSLQEALDLYLIDIDNLQYYGVSDNAMIVVTY